MDCQTEIYLAGLIVLLGLVVVMRMSLTVMICEETDSVMCAVCMVIDLVRRGKLYLGNSERLSRTVLLKLSLLAVIVKPNFGRAEVV